MENKKLPEDSLVLKEIKELKELVGVIIAKLAEGDKRFNQCERVLEDHWRAIQDNKKGIDEIKIEVKKIKSFSTVGLMRFSMPVKVFLISYFVAIMGVFLYVAFK
jgi:hypothetical protein